MNRIGKISSVQMFSVLFLCRMVSLLTLMLPSTSILPSGDRIISCIPIMIFEYIYLAIVCYVLKKNDYKSLISASDEKSASAKALAVLFTLTFVWFAGIAAARFDLFISTVMFPNSELYIMIILLLGASLYASLKGTEAIGRVSVILIAVLGISILFIMLSVTENFEYTNLKPLFTKGFSPVLSFSFYVSVRAPELLTLYVTAPQVNGNIRKMMTVWVLSITIVAIVILTILLGVTGEYGDDQIFPLYTLTVIAKLGMFERLDDILTGIWVLCSFIQVSFLLNTGLSALEQGFGKIKKLPVGGLLAAGVFLVYLLASETVTAFSEILSSKLVDIIFIVIIAVIPLSVIGVKHFGKRRRI